MESKHVKYGNWIDLAFSDYLIEDLDDDGEVEGVDDRADDGEGLDDRADEGMDGSNEGEGMDGAADDLDKATDRAKGLG